MKQKPLFQRGRINRPKHRTDVVAPTVLVTIAARDDKHRWLIGNMSKTLTIREAQVSQVAAVVERALFGDE